MAATTPSDSALIWSIGGANAGTTGSSVVALTTLLKMPHRNRSGSGHARDRFRSRLPSVFGHPILLCLSRPAQASGRRTVTEGHTTQDNSGWRRRDRASAPAE